MLEVGRITKSHGLKGEVIVELFTPLVERLAPGATLHTAEGILVVVRSSPHQGRWIVAFEGVSDRDGSDALRGTVLSAEPVEVPDVLWIHELIGSTVVDVRGTEHGRVVTVIANPASDLLELEGGQLVPVRFVTSSTPGQVVVDPPDGLL